MNETTHYASVSNFVSTRDFEVVAEVDEGGFRCILSRTRQAFGRRRAEPPLVDCTCECVIVPIHPVLVVRVFAGLGMLHGKSSRDGMA